MIPNPRLGNRPTSSLLTAVCLLALLGLASGCSTATNYANEEYVPPGKPPTTKSEKNLGTQPATGVSTVDLDAVQKEVGLTISREDLGYHARVYQSGRFILLQFQLACRSTEDTTSEIVTAADRRAIANQEISWTIKNYRGIAITDKEGFGQIRLLATRSLKDEHVRMTLGNDFLYLMIADVNKILAPLSWCRE